MTTTNRPLPPSRRTLLTLIAGGAVAVPMAAPARALDALPIGPRIAAAADRMDAADAAVAVAWGNLDAAEDRFKHSWLGEHPEPAGKKRHRRWTRAREKARAAACLAEHEAVNCAERTRRGSEALLATLAYQAVRS